MPIDARQVGALGAERRVNVRGSPDVFAPADFVRVGPGLSAGARAAVSAAFAMITSKAGMAPPYRYAAVQATMTVNGVWSQVSGGVAYNNVFNLEEQGAGGQWVNPLVVGDVVLIFAAPDPGVDAFVCTRSHYRGTY